VPVFKKFLARFCPTYDSKKGVLRPRGYVRASLPPTGAVQSSCVSATVHRRPILSGDVFCFLDTECDDCKNNNVG